MKLSIASGYSEAGGRQISEKYQVKNNERCSKYPISLKLQDKGYLLTDAQLIIK